MLVTPPAQELPHTSDVLNFLQNYINQGGTGSAYSFALISTGAHDMMDGIPSTTTQANLVAIGAACATLGVRCVNPDIPQILMESTTACPVTGTPGSGKATILQPLAASFYTLAEEQCANIMILDNQVWQILQHMPDYASPAFGGYIAPDYENVAYSTCVPHYNAAGANAFAAGLWAIYSQLP